MIILGIDPGYAIVGYGVVKYDNNKFTTLAYGAITTLASTPYLDRLGEIYEQLDAIIKLYKPDCMSVEKIFSPITKKLV